MASKAHPRDPSDGPAKMTPMLKQYFSVKRQYPDALLFFRMGDFFELFFEDAKIAARILGIALTSRSKEQDMPMAGVPVKAADGYLQDLIRAGQTVVICDQVEDPRQAKGIVERAVTRIVTAGTVIEDSLLKSGRHNYLAAVSLPPPGGDPDRVGLAWLDLSTARFEGTSCTRAELEDEWNRIGPVEGLVPVDAGDDLPEALTFLRALDHCALTQRPTVDFDARTAHRRLCEHFGVDQLRSFGIDAEDPLVAAAGAILAYVQETQRGLIGHVCRLVKRSTQGVMMLDRSARAALELLETTRDQRKEGSLHWCLDRTETSAGSRLLRDWILEPLTDPGDIEGRQAGVAELHEGESMREFTRSHLRGVFDLERITARLATGRCSPRDLAQVRDSLAQLPDLKTALEDCVSEALRGLSARLVAPEGLLDLLDRALVDRPPLTLKEGGAIRPGFSEELDRLRKLRFDSRNTIAELQRKEVEESGIPSLKIGFNSVFGYYIEVTHAHRQRVPSRYIRKQTLKNAERYITPELKQYETEVLRAEERGTRLEQDLFEQLRADAAVHVRALQDLAQAIAQLDVLASLAAAAREHGWTRPTLDRSHALIIEEGRHPVLAQTLGRDSFVPNDCSLGGEEACFALITGPNMAGKSTYLRQTALIVLLAQMGSFVPARRAHVGLVDRIFTRVGAADDLVRGASTFMVEMTETASILHHATRRSLVILDEVGRGTGTFDGLSLARSLAEHLAEEVGCRTLFATHYHQLTQMAEQFDSICNLTVAIQEWGDEIIFLHRIQPGGTDRSYGIHVARLAGIPAGVLSRAQEILAQLETLSPELQIRTTRGAAVPPAPPAAELSLDASQTIRKLRRADVDNMTPLQALNFLARLREDIEGKLTTRKRRPAESRPSLFEQSAGGAASGDPIRGPSSRG